MKFTKEEAYKELVGKLTAKGEKLNLSERTLNRQLETLIKFVANDEMELADFITAIYDDVKSLDSQYRKDNSDFIKEWEKNHPSPTEPKPNPQTEPANGNTSPEMEAIMKRLAALEDENKAIKKEKSISDIKSQLKKSLKEKGIDDDEWVDLMLQKVSITNEFDIEAESEFYLKLYNKSNSIPKQPATPHSTTGGGGSSQMDDAIALASANMKRKREEEEKLLN